MKNIIFLIKEVWNGKSITRSFLNMRLKDEVLVGKVMDIGGGKSSDYLSFMKRSKDVDFISFDIKAGIVIDFENDSLPLQTDSCDTVIFLNVMEHVFNYQHIANEVVRIVKPGGQLIGFVPFLMWYHADHRDFFRYTHEALDLIFNRAEATHVIIEPVSHGPFTASLQMLSQLLPRFLNIPLLVLFYAIDALYLKLKPSQIGRYALGYYFKLAK